MIKKTLLIMTFITSPLIIISQDVSTYLKQVSENNRELVAYRNLLSARQAEAKTGLTPADPFISAGYMPGISTTPGSKHTWSLTQSFSFPAKYLFQRNISLNNITLAEEEFKLAKIRLLLEAEIILSDLVYNKKVLELLAERQEIISRLKIAWGNMLENREATILDYNKIAMELSSVSLEISGKKTQIDILERRLVSMSGDSNSFPEYIEYPIIKDFDLDSLLKVKALIHPSYRLPELESQKSNEELKLARTGRLPEFQVGYASEIVPDEGFKGPVAGMSIPLWSNSNVVKSATANEKYARSLKDSEFQRLDLEVTNEYSNMKALEKSISEIKGIIESTGDKQILEEALTSSEITLTEFFTYLQVIFDAEEQLLDLENQYYKVSASLADHELLKY